MKTYIVLLQGDTGARYVERGWNGYNNALEIIPCATKKKAEEIAQEIRDDLHNREDWDWHLHCKTRHLFDEKYRPMLKKASIVEHDKIYGDYNDECDQIYKQWKIVWRKIEVIEKEVRE